MTRQGSRVYALVQLRFWDSGHFQLDACVRVHGHSWRRCRKWFPYLAAACVDSVEPLRSAGYAWLLPRAIRQPCCRPPCVSQG